MQPITITRGRVLAVVTGAACIAALAACGSGDGTASDADGTVTLEFWDDSAGATTTPRYEELIERFEAENPGIEVNYLGLPPGESPQKYNAAITNEATPDVGSVTSSRLGAILAQNALIPLDDRLESSELNGSLQEGLLDGLRDISPDGELYAVPFRGNLELMWYRKSLFAEAGVDVPQTWDEFFAAAEALTDPAAGRYGYTIRGGSGGIFQVMTEAFAASGAAPFFDDEGTANLRDPDAVAHIERMAEIYGTYTPEADLTNGYSEMVAQFTEGEIAMMHHDLFSASTLRTAFGDDLGAFPLPRQSESDPHTQLMSGVPGYGIFAGSDHPDEAWAFVEFLLSHESNSYLVEAFGSVPANLDAAQDEWTLDQPGIVVANEILADARTQTLFAPMYLPDYSSIETTQSEPEYQSVLLGETSAEDFVSTLAETFETAEAEYRDRNG